MQPNELANPVGKGQRGNSVRNTDRVKESTNRIEMLSSLPEANLRIGFVESPREL